MQINEWIEKLSAIEKNGLTDGSLTSRIPTWLTAGDGRQYLHSIHEEFPVLIEMVKILSEGMKLVEGESYQSHEIAKEALARCEKLLEDVE